MTTDSDRLDRVIELLGAIALKLGAVKPPPRPPMTDAERAGWRELNRPRSAQTDGEYPSSTTTKEAFYRRKDV